MDDLRFELTEAPDGTDLARAFDERLGDAAVAALEHDGPGDLERIALRKEL